MSGTPQGGRVVEDFAVGQVFDVGYRDVTEEEIIRFAKEYDPHPFHIDPVAAKETMFGGLMASGWQTVLFMMRMMHNGFLTVETSLGSPGVDEVRWLLPVRPGDRLHGKVEVLDVRISKSKPELGFIDNRATLINQDGKLVYSLRSKAMFKTRLGAGRTG
jgi:acyl dehydratase